MVVPLKYELKLLRGVCRLLPGRDPPPEVPDVPLENLQHLPLPNANTKGPPRDWVVEHGPTPRCRSCKARGVGYDKLIHTARCRARYAEFIRGSFDPNAVVERDQGEVQDLGEQGFER